MVSQILIQIVLKIEKPQNRLFKSPCVLRPAERKNNRLKTNGKHVNNIFRPQFGD
jgi:hypothetical protein